MIASKRAQPFLSLSLQETIIIIILFPPSITMVHFPSEPPTTPHQAVRTKDDMKGHDVQLVGVGPTLPRLSLLGKDKPTFPT